MKLVFVHHALFIFLRKFSFMHAEENFPLVEKFPIGEFSYRPLHCTALHCTALHCTALHCAALHCTTLHCTVLQSPALHCIRIHCSAIVFTALHYNTLQWIAIHYNALHYRGPPCIVWFIGHCSLLFIEDWGLGSVVK